MVTNKTTSNIRLKEIKKVKKLTNAKTEVSYIGNEFCRLDTIPQKDLIEKIEDVIDKVKPSIIAIPSSSSYNQDHRAVYDACIAALRPIPKNVRHFVPTVIEYYEPYIWSARETKLPNTYLDMNESIDKGNLLDFKIKLYKCHSTQVRNEPFPRSIENITRIAHVYGKEIGVSVAEAYHCLRLEIS